MVAEKHVLTFFGIIAKIAVNWVRNPKFSISSNSSITSFAFLQNESHCLMLNPWFFLGSYKYVDKIVVLGIDVNTTKNTNRYEPCIWLIFPLPLLLELQVHE
jgi:hypothetical protein